MNIKDPMIIKEYKTKHSKSERKKFCSACYHDRYNHPGIQDGGAPVTSKECWHLADSRIVLKKVYFRSSQIKPNIVKILNCFTPIR